MKLNSNASKYISILFLLLLIVSNIFIIYTNINLEKENTVIKQKIKSNNSEKYVESFLEGKKIDRKELNDIISISNSKYTLLIIFNLTSCYKCSDRTLNLIANLYNSNENENIIKIAPIALCNSKKELEIFTRVKKIKMPIYIDSLNTFSVITNLDFNSIPSAFLLLNQDYKVIYSFIVNEDNERTNNFIKKVFRFVRN